MLGMSDFQARLTEPVESCGTLTEKMIWSTNGPTIWKADRFKGSPVFYPVYKYRDYYSYSLISLILRKKCLKVNKRWVKKAGRRNFVYNSGYDTIDEEIKRLGRPQKCGFKIKKPYEYAQKIAQALIKDCDEIEKNHPDFTNIIMCGGKDSLNLLLIPWKNPVLVASASPNYELVKQFISDNGLGFRTVELKDDNTSILKAEILINCCRANLEHFRWGYDLVMLAKSFNQKVIFWKGQLGSQLKPNWKSSEQNILYRFIHRVFKIVGGKGQYKFKQILEKSNFTQRFFFLTLWVKGAMWQGSHMSLIRQLTNALTLSAYHGPEVQRVVAQVDMKYAVNEDTRPLIGEALHGRHVIYPAVNPEPLNSLIRKGLSHFEPFAEELRSIGIPVYF